MKANKIIETPEYWESRIQILLFNEVENYMKKHKLNRSQFAEKLGVSKGYVSQILNGNYNFSISKFVELVLSIDKVPDIEFKSIADYEEKISEKNLEISEKLRFRIVEIEDNIFANKFINLAYSMASMEAPFVAETKTLYASGHRKSTKEKSKYLVKSH